MKDGLIQLAGWGLCLVALLDLYLTVLYARSDISLISARLYQLVWRAFRTVAARLRGSLRDRVLTFAGPTLVVLVVAMWTGALLIGFALIWWPALGEEIKKTSGPTPTDFATALYYSGYTLATVGYGDIVPQTAFYRVLAVIEGLIGFSVITLSLTYLMSVYSALVRRNTLALALHHQSAGTDNAAELLARLGAGGEYGNATQQLSRLAERLHDLYESHHSYPILHYFHFREPFYGMAHLVGTIADLATLSVTALDQKHHRGFAESAAVAESSSGTNYLLTRLSGLFLPATLIPQDNSKPTEQQDRQWRIEFAAAVERLAAAGAVVVNEQASAARKYVALRHGWDPYVSAFRGYMLERPAGTTVQSTV